MDFTAVVPFRNGHATLGRLLDSLPAALPVIVVDDGSDPPLADSPRYRLIRLAERGYFAGAVNAGLAACATDALILNQDVWLEGEAWLHWLAEHRARYSVLGHGQMRHPAWPQGYVQGQLMYVRREAWDAVGPFNARDYPLWGATAEWQLRACRRGHRALPVAAILGLHHERPPGEAFGASIAAALSDQPERRGWLIRTPPLLSVIVTSQRYGRYLPDCLASLIGGESSLGMLPGQTFQSFEVVIVDDGSTDETAEIGRALADPWKAVRYIRREHNGGTPAANNTGIRAAFGHYVTILCADDMREPGSLEALYRVVEADPRAVAYDDLCEFAHGRRTQRRQLGEYSFAALVRKNMMHAGILFHRRAWDEAGGYHEAMREGREDWQFNIALGLRGYCGRRVPQFGYLYRREGQNRSLGNAGPEWSQAFQAQLRGIFGTGVMDQGVFPMGCCGGGAAPAPNGQRSGFYANDGGGEMSDEIGAEGMVLLRYLGGNTGTESWYGPAPARRRYVFGGKRQTGYVDQRDVEHLLALRENRRQVFALVEAEPPLGMEPAVKLEPGTAAIDPEAAALRLVADLDPRHDSVEVELISAPPPPGDLILPVLGEDGQWVEGDPSALTVAALKALLPGATAGQRERMRALESEGRNRKGVLDAIDGYIETETVRA